MRNMHSNCLLNRYEKKKRKILMSITTEWKIRIKMCCGGNTLVKSVVLRPAFVRRV